MNEPLLYCGHTSKQKYKCNSHPILKTFYFLYTQSEGCSFCPCPHSHGLELFLSPFSQAVLPVQNCRSGARTVWLLCSPETWTSIQVFCWLNRYPHHFIVTLSSIIFIAVFSFCMCCLTNITWIIVPSFHGSFILCQRTFLGWTQLTGWKVQLGQRVL